MSEIPTSSEQFDPSLRNRGLKPPLDIELRDGRTAKQRGVYALRAFGAGEVVEICPVLWLRCTIDDLPRILKFYTFDWGDLTGGGQWGEALAFGMGSMYNGANPANMRYEAEWDCPYPFMRFIADRDISNDEELTINYSGLRGAAASETDRWFIDHGITMVR